MTERSKSVTHGTCALDGQHTDPTTAAECPVLRKRFRANQSRSGERPATTLQGVPEVAPSSPEKSGTSDTVFRYSRARKSGRPRVAPSEQRRKARERVRAYRGSVPRRIALHNPSFGPGVSSLGGGVLSLGAGDGGMPSMPIEIPHSRIPRRIEASADVNDIALGRDDQLPCRSAQEFPRSSAAARRTTSVQPTFWHR